MSVAPSEETTRVRHSPDGSLDLELRPIGTHFPSKSAAVEFLGEVIHAVDARRPLSPDSPLVVGVSGAGGVGKSRLAAQLSDYLGESAHALDLDDYVLPRDERATRGLRSGYDPRANDLALAAAHLMAIRQGHPVDKPVYDHATGQRRPFKETVTPFPVIVAEGVTALYPELFPHITLPIFLWAPETVQLQTRLQRDVEKRGYSWDEARAHHEDAYADYKAFIRPTMEQADLVFDVAPDYSLRVHAAPLNGHLVDTLVRRRETTH